MATEGDTSEPLTQAIDVINKLLALAKDRGFGREAYSIAIGEELPERPKRGPGAPSKKSPEREQLLALMMAFSFLQKSEQHGARVQFARDVAQQEFKQEGRKASQTEVGKRVRQIQNEISKIRPEILLFAVYWARRIDAGESEESLGAFIHAAFAGDSDAHRDLAQKVLEATQDVRVRRGRGHSHKKSG